MIIAHLVIKAGLSQAFSQLREKLQVWNCSVRICSLQCRMKRLYLPDKTSRLRWLSWETEQEGGRDHACCESWSCQGSPDGQQCYFPAHSTFSSFLFLLLLQCKAVYHHVKKNCFNKMCLNMFSWYQCQKSRGTALHKNATTERWLPLTAGLQLSNLSVVSREATMPQVSVQAVWNLTK